MKKIIVAILLGAFLFAITGCHKNTCPAVGKADIEMQKDETLPA